MPQLPEPLSPKSNKWPWTPITTTREQVGEWPRLTVVTPTWNQGDFIEETIRSILGQGYPNLEYIVVDAGSDDATPKILEHYSAHIDHLIIEPDNGQADAIRKGLELATGDWFNWINSDDLLSKTTLFDVAALITAEADMIAGATANFDELGVQHVLHSQAIDFAGLLTSGAGSRTGWHQPSIWVRTKAYREIGLDLNFHYRFDYDAYLRYLNRYPTVIYTDKILANFRVHGASKTVNDQAGFDREQLAILEKLAKDPELDQHWPDIELARRKLLWAWQLEGWLRDRQQPRLIRAGRILLGAAKDPQARWSRLTRKSLRRCLVRGFHEKTEPSARSVDGPSNREL